jgi:hypothetical protein
VASLTQERFASLAETATTADITNVATSLSVGSRTVFPQAGQFRIVVQKSESDETDREIMVVTGGHGTGAGAFTVSRAQDGTTGAAHTSGAYVAQWASGAALERHLPDYVFQPRHMGLLATNWDPVRFQNAAATTTLVPYLSKVFIPEPMTLTNVHCFITVAGSTLTAGSNQMGVFNSSGTRIGATTAATTLTAFTSTGRKDLVLTVDGGQSLTVNGEPGLFVWVAILASGTTIPTFKRATGNGGIQNTLLGNADARFGTLAAVTSGNGLPTSFTPSSGITQGSNAYWVALS